MNKSIERRQDKRARIVGAVDLDWTDDKGDMFMTSATCIDISGGGMKIEMRVRIAVGTAVNFRSPDAGFRGRGLVRYCRASQGAHQVGIEFRGRLQRQVRLTGEV